MKKKPTYEELEQRVKELEMVAVECKRTEKELRIKDSAIATSINAIAFADLEGNLTYTNNSFLKLWGYDDENGVLGKPAAEFWQIQDQAEAVEDALRDKGGWVGELVARRRDGSLFDVRLVATMITDNAGEPICMMGSFVDITECKRSKEEIEKLSSAVAQSIDGIAVGDLEPKLTYANDAFARMHGYAPHEMVGIKAKRLHNAEQMKVFTKAIHKIKTQASWMGEIGHIRKDGTPFPTYMSITLLKDNKGKPTGILAVCRDKTECKRAEETIEASEAQKQAILDASVDMIRLVDRDMRIIWANKTTTRELNTDPQELAGQKCYEIFIGRKTPCSACPTKKALKSGQMEHAVVHQYPPRYAKREAYCDNYAVPIKNESGDIVSFVQITRNITKRKLVERALREREKELKIKTNTLSELNAALRVLIEKKDNDRLETEQKVLFNVKQLVIPFLERLKKTSLTSEQSAYLYILESNFNDIISPFSRTLSSKYLSLTPTEIQVANLVKDGKTSQEIAEVMNLSRRTVESHRDGIRKKLDLKNRRANLRSHLLSI
jgi:PAS domain S-box-containing protein